MRSRICYDINVKVYFEKSVRFRRFGDPILFKVLYNGIVKECPKPERDLAHILIKWLGNRHFGDPILFKVLYNGIVKKYPKPERNLAPYINIGSVRRLSN